MITKESTDKEILDYPIDQVGNIVRNMGGISFIGWVANKINGVPTYTAATQELLMLVKSPPLGRIPDGEKVKIVRKLLSLDIQI